MDFSIKSDIDFTSTVLGQGVSVEMMTNNNVIPGSTNVIRNVIVPPLPTTPDKKYVLSYDVNLNQYIWAPVI